MMVAIDCVKHGCSLKQFCYTVDRLRHHIVLQKLASLAYSNHDVSHVPTVTLFSIGGQWSVAYLGGGPRCDGPPFGRTMKIFYRRLYMKRCVLPFSSKNCKIRQCLMDFCVYKFQKKWANLRFLLNIQKQKVFQLQALPLDLAGSSAPRPPW